MPRDLIISHAAGMNSTMSVAEAESTFVERLSEYLVSLPYDLKILQEAVTDPDLEKSVRLMAACTVVHTMLPQEGEPGPLRYIDDVLFVHPRKLSAERRRVGTPVALPHPRTSFSGDEQWA